MILTEMLWGGASTSTVICPWEYISTSLRGPTQESQDILTKFYQSLINTERSDSLSDRAQIKPLQTHECLK